MNIIILLLQARKLTFLRGQKTFDRDCISGSSIDPLNITCLDPIDKKTESGLEESTRIRIKPISKCGSQSETLLPNPPEKY